MLVNFSDLENILGRSSFPFCFEEDYFPISTDSREIKLGDIFFALVGAYFDGHDYLQEVIQKKKIRAVVVQKTKKNLVDNLGVPYFLVEDTEHSLFNLATWYGTLFNCQKIVITGSNGKTTLKNYLRFVLQQTFSTQGFSKNKVLASPGSYNNKIGVSKSLLNLRKYHEIAIFEIGTNHPGEIKPLVDSICPQVSILTTIGESHLEYFKSVENVYLEKTSFLENFKGTLIVNGDDLLLQRIEAKGFKLICVGLHKQYKNFKIEDIKYDEFYRASFLLEGFPISLKNPGEHQIINSMLVYIASQVLKFNSVQVLKSLSDFISGDIRNQILKIKQVTILNDCYNANPSSMLKSLEILNFSKINGKKIAVLGGMEELGSWSEQRHFEIGQWVAKSSIDYLFCFTLHLNSEQYYLGALDMNMNQENVFKCLSIVELVKAVLSLMKPQDMILVKASRNSCLEEFTTLLKEYED